jgi:hypothetical protein
MLMKQSQLTQKHILILNSKVNGISIGLPQASCAGFHTNANSPWLIKAPKTNGDYFYTEYNICTAHMYKEQNRVSHSQISDGSNASTL